MSTETQSSESKARAAAITGMPAHIPEYLAEFAATGLMLLIGLSAISVNFGEGSPVVDWLPNPHLRRLLTGIIFAGGATIIVYSPLGKRSGAHLNPAVTLAFFLLGKVGPRDAIAYVVAQVAAALLAATAVRLLWGDLAASVKVGATLPGIGGPAAAVAAEIAITFLLVSLILNFVDRTLIARYTGIAAGTLVAFLVFAEAPVSGTSLNPARSLGPAAISGEFIYIWIYLAAPLVGSLLAVWLFRRFRQTTICAKLFHQKQGERQCIFKCGYDGTDHRI